MGSDSGAAVEGISASKWRRNRGVVSVKTPKPNREESLIRCGLLALLYVISITAVHRTCQDRTYFSGDRSYRR